MNKLLNIEKAKYLSNYKIYFKFNDGTEKIINFKKFLFQSLHKDIQKYQNKELFKNFNLEYGEIEWNDYELVFPIFDLYEGRV